MHRQVWLLVFVFFVSCGLSSASLFGEYRFLRAKTNCGGCATRCLLKEKKCEPKITRPNTPECDKSCEPSKDIVCTLNLDNGECTTTGQSTDREECKNGEEYCAAAENKCMTKKDCESFGKDTSTLPPPPTRPPSRPFICGNCPCNKVEGKAECKQGEAKTEVCKKCNYECRLIDDQCHVVFRGVDIVPPIACKTPGEEWCVAKEACMKKEECTPPTPPSVCECTIGTMKCKGKCENDKKSELKAEDCTNPKQPLYCPRYKHCVAYDDECNGEAALPIVDCKPCPVGSLRPCKNSKGRCKSSEYQTCTLSKSKRDVNPKTPISCPAGSKRVKAGDCVAFEVECGYKHQVICKKKVAPSPNPST